MQSCARSDQSSSAGSHYCTNYLSRFFYHMKRGLFWRVCEFLSYISKKVGSPLVLFGAMAVVGFPLVAYFGKKLNYDRTEYKILEGRLEFEEGFFNINEKVIKFKDVKEVTPRKSFLQRIYDLGTISGDRRDRLLSADQCIFCSRIRKRVREWRRCLRHPQRNVRENKKHRRYTEGLARIARTRRPFSTLFFGRASLTPQSRAET